MDIPLVSMVVGGILEVMEILRREEGRSV